MSNALLTEEEVTLLRNELETAQNPLFFYDGDCDGLTSFLLLYRLHYRGKGIGLTSTARALDEKFVRKVQELQPDKIFILDIPTVTQEFIDQTKKPTFWIDHHPPLQRTNVHYFNPRLKDPEAYVPTSRMAWQVSQKEEDLWIATAGCMGDFHLPDFLDTFIAKYPQFLTQKEDLPTMLFKRPVGRLVKFFFFIQKGPQAEVRRSVKVLTRIQSVEEIFQQTTAQGKYLFKRFEQINQKYSVLLKQAKKAVTKNKLILFNYTEDQWSFTANVANELSGLYPQKIVLIVRKKSGEMKCSLRGKKVSQPLQKALLGIEGYGGGHPDACGAVIKEKDWESFLGQFKKAIGEEEIINTGNNQYR